VLAIILYSIPFYRLQPYSMSVV